MIDFCVISICSKQHDVIPLKSDTGFYLSFFLFILPSCLHMSNHKLWFVLIKFSHLIHKIPIKFIWLICLLRYCKLCPIQYNPLSKAENVTIVWPGCLKDFSKRWGRLSDVWGHSLCSWLMKKSNSFVLRVGLKRKNLWSTVPHFESWDFPSEIQLVTALR